MNEVIASKLCMRLGVPAVRYSLARNGNRLVSTCADMLSNHEELVSAWQVLQSARTINGLNSHDQWIRAAVGFGADERAVRDATDDWLVADYLMRNTDRDYSNFGLIRDIETLAVRPAPIYDTGASLWSGELDVDGRDWFAKPFYTATGRPSALRQLRLVEDWNRFDLDALSDWPDEAAHELSRMRMFAPERLDAIRDQLVKRIGTIRRIREGKALRASDPIRNRADLLDRFGDTLRKNLARQDGDDKSAGIDYKGPRHHMGH